MVAISIRRLSRFATLLRVPGITPFAGPTCKRQSVQRPSLIVRWFDRVRQRFQLAAMDERLLRDIGLTRADVAREVEKSFWQR